MSAPFNSAPLDEAGADKPNRRLIPLKKAAPPYFVGIDLGGTNIKLGLVDDEGRTLAYRSIPTDVEKGPEDGARRMGEAARQLMQGVGISDDDIPRVGLATPGTMDIPAGMLLKPHNLPGWFDFPIRDRVSHYCKKPVTYANDAGAAAFGEYWSGTGKDFRSLIFFTLGTGVGGGIILDNRSLDGEHSCGAEFGHITIDGSPDARLCPCGRPGHLEAYASATGLVRRTVEAIQAGRATSLAAVYRERRKAGDTLTALDIATAAEDGDVFAKRMVLETAAYLGVGVSTMLHVLDPDGVVLGGAMTFGGAKSPLGQQFLARLREEVALRSLEPVTENLKIDFASLGGDAGFIGAAGLARADVKAGRHGTEASDGRAKGGKAKAGKSQKKKKGEKAKRKG